MTSRRGNLVEMPHDKRSNTARKRVRGEWDGPAEMDLLRHFCREDFWTFFLYGFGDALSPKGKEWVDPDIHEPLARWYQMHVEEWLGWRSEGLVRQKHLIVIVHRETGKSRMITGAGQLWLHAKDPELSSYTGSESLELSTKLLNILRAKIDGSDPYSMFVPLFGNWSEGARQWSARAIVHAARTQTSRADPSLGTFAVETSIVGAHPDAIFYDDPISYERLTSDTNWIAAVKSQVSSLVPVLQGNGLLVWVGTRYDSMDHIGSALYSTNEDGEIVSNVATLSGMQTDSITTSADGHIHVYFLAGRDHDGKPTTPKVWPEERLRRYQKTDPLRYASQVMNDPSISELNPITREQIAQCGVKKDEVPWSNLRIAICCDTAFSDGNRISVKDETVMVVHGYPRNGSGDVYIIEGFGNATMRAEDFGKLLVSTVQRYRKQGFKIVAITDEKTRAGKKDAWRLTLQNFFADVNEPMPRFIEFERGRTQKYERLHAASTFWVDGHVRYVRGAPGMDRLCEQMARIGQYAVNPRIKIDWADAHSDAFQTELYAPMRRQQVQTPWDRLPPRMEEEEDQDSRLWAETVPRAPIR